MQYPGKDIAEAAVVVPSRALATKIVQGRLLDAIGWWWLRQDYSRHELVEKGVCSRSQSYRRENIAREMFGKEVEEVTRKELREYVARIGTG